MINKSLMMQVLEPNRMFHLENLADKNNTTPELILRKCVDLILNKYYCTDQYMGTELYAKHPMRIIAETLVW